MVTRTLAVTVGAGVGMGRPPGARGRMESGGIPQIEGCRNGWEKVGCRGIMVA